MQWPKSFANVAGVMMLRGTR